MADLNIFIRAKDETQGALESLGGRFTQYITNPVVAATAAVTGLATGLALMVRGQIESRVEFANLARNAQVSTDAIQTWGNVAEQTGGSAEDVADAMREMQLRLAEAAELGSGPAVDALNILGVSLLDLEGLDAPAQFALLRDSISDVEDPAQRLFLAEELLGGSTERLQGVFSATRTEVENLTRAYEESGNRVSEEGIQKAVEFDQAMTDLRNSIQGVVQPLTTELLPALTAMADFVSGTAIPAFRDFIDLIRNVDREVEEAAEQIETSYIEAAEAILEEQRKLHEDYEEDDRGFWRRSLDFLQEQAGAEIESWRWRGEQLLNQSGIYQELQESRQRDRLERAEEVELAAQLQELENRENARQTQLDAERAWDDAILEQKRAFNAVLEEENRLSQERITQQGVDAYRARLLDLGIFLEEAYRAEAEAVNEIQRLRATLTGETFVPEVSLLEGFSFSPDFDALGFSTPGISRGTGTGTGGTGSSTTVGVDREAARQEVVDRRAARRLELSQHRLGTAAYIDVQLRHAREDLSLATTQAERDTAQARINNLNRRLLDLAPEPDEGDGPDGQGGRQTRWRQEVRGNQAYWVDGEGNWYLPDGTRVSEPATDAELHALNIAGLEGAERIQAEIEYYEQQQQGFAPGSRQYTRAETQLVRLRGQLRELQAGGDTGDDNDGPCPPVNINNMYRGSLVTERQLRQNQDRQASYRRLKETGEIC